MKLDTSCAYVGTMYMGNGKDHHFRRGKAKPWPCQKGMRFRRKRKNIALCAAS